MRAIVQRVTRATVTVDGEVISAIDRGLLVLVGVGRGDGARDMEWLTEKILTLRIFPGPQGDIDLSVQDVDGELLVVSQFTLYGDARKGRRPSFSAAAAPEVAEELYQQLLARLRSRQVQVFGGRFGAHMRVELVNDGPVTLILDSPSTLPSPGRSQAGVPGDPS